VHCLGPYRYPVERNPGIDERWAEQLRIPAVRPFLIEMIAKKAHCNA
jgi:hypothetical protein